MAAIESFKLVLPSTIDKSVHKAKCVCMCVAHGLLQVEVNGPGTHPVFQYLKTHLPVELGGGGGKGPGKDLVWNFQKFLVDKKGNPVKFFMQTYDRIAIEHAVYAALHAQ